MGQPFIAARHTGEMVLPPDRSTIPRPAPAAKAKAACLPRTPPDNLIERTS
ncbi:MAG: hypothetical protein HPY64_11405 [Anaerolineae bacterium]|nr:hypothetical protein [Anaerolineae bacterium]